MHGVAPQMCGQVAYPLLGGGAGARSPGFLLAIPLATKKHCQRLRLTAEWWFRGSCLLAELPGLRLGLKTGVAMLRSWAVVPAMLAMCVTGVARAESSTQILQFETVPPGALVRTTGGQTCRTPCSLTVPLAMPLAAQSVIFSMNGYTPQTVPLDLHQDNPFSPVVYAPNPVMVTLQAEPKPVIPKPKSRKAHAQAKVTTKPTAAPALKQDNAPPPPPPTLSPVESRFWTPPPQPPPTR